MVKLINHEHLYIAQPPLYRVKSTKEEHWVYSEQEKDEVFQKLSKPPQMGFSDNPFRTERIVC
jgi:DNA gyrase subunit B